MKKRILSLFLVAIMVLTLLPATAFAKSGGRISARASAGGTVVNNIPGAPDWECRPVDDQYDGEVTCTLSADGKTLTLSWTSYSGEARIQSYTAAATSGSSFKNWTYTVGGTDSVVLVSGTKITSDVLASNRVVFIASFVHQHDGVTFQPWGDADDGDEDGEITGLPTEAGNYYLTDDVTIDSSWNVHWGTTNLCLNGHVIKLELAALDAQNTGSVIIIPDSATLTIYDCNTTAEHYFYEDNGLWVLDDTLGADSADHIVIGGVITGGTGKQTSTLPIGGGVTNRGTFILNSGSIVGNTTTGEGGGVENNYNKIFTMNGGMICGNTARRGGGVLNLGEKMVMTGGIISDNYAGNGGGVCNSGPTIIMTGGKISGNVATGIGGGIDNYDGEVILGGNAVIAGNFKNSTIPNDIEYNHDEDEDWEAIVRISSETAPADGMYVGLIGDDTTVRDASSGDVKYFFADDPTRYVAFDNKGTAGDTSDDILKLAALGDKKKVSVSHPANGTVYTDKQAAAADETVTVTAVPNEGYVLKSVSYNDGIDDYDAMWDGNAYKFNMPNSDVTVTAEFATYWRALSDALAGAQGTTAGVFTVENDTPESGARTITLLTDFTAGENDSALVVPFEEKVVLDLNGHVLDRNLTDKNAAYFEEYYSTTGVYLEEVGNVITMMEDAELTITDSNTGSLKHKFTVLESGENKGLWMLDEENGTEEVTGGVITGGVSTFGGVLVGKNNGEGYAFATSTVGSFTLEGGSIVGNINVIEGLGGGGVYVSEGKFTMNGGAITGNYAKGSGGSCHGGGVFVADRQNFVMEGGTIRDNIADTSGGGVFVSYGAQFTMNGGSIKDNRCLSNNEYSVGGGIYVNGNTYVGMEDRAAFTMTGGEISGNEALDGGGIYAESGSITISGGSITGNEAVGITAEMRDDWSASGGRGGGIYLCRETCVFEMSGGSITDNVASGTGSYGGGLVVDDGTNATINAAEISGNQAGTGAGIWAFYAATKLNLTAASGKTITITGNEATENHLGVGVYCDYNKTELSGELLIKENTYSGEGKETKTPADLAAFYISYPEVVAPLTVSDALTGSEIHASLIKDEYDEELGDNVTVPIAGVLTKDYGEKSGKTSGAVDEFFHYVGTDDLKMILNSAGELEVVKKSFIDNQTPESDKDYNNGYITVQEQAFPGDIVEVTVVPNSGYQLESLWFYNNDEDNEYEITDAKTFVMPVYGADIYALFEEAAVSGITVSAIASPAKIASGGSVTISGTVMDGDTPVTSGNVYVQVGAIQTPLILTLNSDGSYSKTLQDLQGSEPIVFTVTYSYDGENYRASCTVEFEEIAPVFAVTFDMNGHGTTPAAISVTSGAAISSDQLPAPTESGYTFGGWFREAACENAWNDIDIVTGDMTLYAKWVENTKTVVSTPTVTVPVSGDENSVSVKATVSGKIATIQPISNGEIEKVIGDDVETGMVAIDLSGTNKTITGAKLPTETVQAIAEAASETGNDTAGLKLVLSSGTLEFDAKALETIAAAAGDAVNIEIHFDEVGTTRLNNVQKEAVSEMDVLEGFEAYVTVNGKRVSDFEGGSVTVYIPYEVPEDKDPAAYTVWYVAEDGTLEKMNTSYDGENHRFVVSHFSDYVLTYDETAGQYNNCPKDETCPMAKFTDLDLKAWYHDGVHYCLDNGIMAGFPGNLFKPNGTTTRAQIAQILYNLEGQPAFMNDNVFTDVVSGSWYEKAVVWAQGKGIVSGYPDGTFKPNDSITREQLAVILYNYAKYKEIDVTVDENTNFLSFNDFWDTSEWAKPAMMWAIDRELIVGTNWDLKPQGDAVRAQAATIIWKFCETVAK